MNENVQGPVQLAGAGLVRRGSRHYEPGEYSELTNLVITSEGTIRKRPPFQGLIHATSKPFSKFIGTFGSWSIATYSDVAGGPKLYQCKDFNVTSPPVEDYTNMYTNLDELTSSVAGARIDKNIQFEGYLVYNNIEHLITWYNFKIDHGVPNDYHGFLTVQTAPIASVYEPAAPSSYSASGTIIYQQEIDDIDNDTYYANNLWFPVFPTRGFALHKDRLWIAVGNTLYFSAATDLDNFAAPEGGFFKFPDKNIRSIVPLGDFVYVVFDTGIAVVSYQTDPNLDAEIKHISEVIGGDSATVYGDTIFVVNAEALYEVSGHNVSKVRDLELGLTNTDNYAISDTDRTVGKFFDMKIQSFDDGLYILPRVIRQAENSGSPYGCIYTTNGEEEATAGLYRLDLNNGHMSRFLYGGWETSAGDVPSDMIFNPVEDRFNQQKLVFISNDDDASNDNYAFHLGTKQRFFYDTTPPHGQFHANNTFYALDTVSAPDGSGLYAKAYYVKLRIDGFSPDNLRYLIKKFRSINIEGNFPRGYNPATSEYVDELRLLVHAGIEEAGPFEASHSYLSPSTKVLLDEVLTGYLAPFEEPDGAADYISPSVVTAYRYGVNQRCKQISITIVTFNQYPNGNNSDSLVSNFNIGSSGAVGPLKESLMEIVDIRTLWSYTGRGPTGYTRDKS